MYRLTAIALLSTGITLIATVVLPIFSYELLTARRFGRPRESLLSPVAQNWEVPRVVNLTRASNWFVGTPSLTLGEVSSSIKYYTISIPKLKIKQATVEIGGEDLSRNLIQYQGTALPGRIGNSLILGHSVLPQFFNPKNYLTIFSNLPKLKKGDEIVVEYDGITYRYSVSDMFEVEPSNLSVLEQNGDRPQLTLVTCVPPGTYLRRLVVKADLVPPDTL
ncbi:sortase [Candidatus Microgenomates bacterium]|nr:sortase [Candidatus Microgenomates bacterium]